MIELITVTADPSLDSDAAPALARQLETEGLRVRARRVVPAEDGPVGEALRQAIEGGGLVVGLADGEASEVLHRALARRLGSRLVLSARALDALAAMYAARGQAMPRRVEGQALVPQGASVLVGSPAGAPGLLAETPGALVALVPGHVAPALALLREHVLPRLGPRPAEPVVVAHTLRLAGLGLTAVEAGCAEALRGAADVSARALEADGEVWVRIRLRGPSAGATEARLHQLEPALRAAFGDAWYGRDDETLEGVVGRLLRACGWTVALAESCTGGLVGHRLTQVGGSSAYFERGLVVYSNAAKQGLLGVSAEILGRHGAVSAECAEAMARGVRAHAGTDLGVSVTGIAGPEGGTPAKPVGTVFVGLADGRTVVSHRYRFDRDREGNKASSAVMALDLIRRHCLVAVAGAQARVDDG
jgi:nicotinamide-nucleotide amidase